MRTVDTPDQIRRFLLEKYGPLMSGPDLYRALGYSSTPAFTRGMAQGTVGVHVFKLPGRRGTFALTPEVANWLCAQNKTLPAERHSTQEKCEEMKSD